MESQNVENQNKGGRPKKFQSVEELEKMIDAYFKHCDSYTVQKYSEKENNIINIPMPKPYTVSGLAAWLDTDRNTLLDYEKFPENKPFFRTIKRAKAKIQTYVEESLWRPQIAAGIIFNLKNNWGWKDTLTHKDETPAEDKPKQVTIVKNYINQQDPQQNGDQSNS